MPKRVSVAYILRLWRDNPKSNWRASLVNAQTSKQHHFSRLQDLVTFLESSTGQSPGFDGEGVAPTASERGGNNHNIGDKV